MLTIHRIKAGAENYSYKRFHFTIKNLKTLYHLHVRWYATAALGFELVRKLAYPFLCFINKAAWIDPIERFPFFLQGYQIKKLK